MPPEQLPRLLAPIIGCKAEIAIGSRYAEGAKTDVKQPFYRVWWSRLANKVIEVGAGEAPLYPGGYEDFLHWKKLQEAGLAAPLPTGSLRRSSPAAR